MPSLASRMPAEAPVTLSKSVQGHNRKRFEAHTQYNSKKGTDPPPWESRPDAGLPWFWNVAWVSEISTSFSWRIAIRRCNDSLLSLRLWSFAAVGSKLGGILVGDGLLVWRVENGPRFIYRRSHFGRSILQRGCRRWQRLLQSNWRHRQRVSVNICRLRRSSMVDGLIRLVLGGDTKRRLGLEYGGGILVGVSRCSPVHRAILHGMRLNCRGIPKVQLFRGRGSFHVCWTRVG